MFIGILVLCVHQHRWIDMKFEPGQLFPVLESLKALVWGGGIIAKGWGCLLLTTSWMLSHRFIPLLSPRAERGQLHGS